MHPCSWRCGPTLHAPFNPTCNSCAGHREADDKNRYSLPAHLSMKVCPADLCVTLAPLITPARRGSAGRPRAGASKQGSAAVCGSMHSVTLGGSQHGGLGPLLWRPYFGCPALTLQNLELITKAAATTEGVATDGSKFGRWAVHVGLQQRCFLIGVAQRLVGRLQARLCGARSAANAALLLLLAVAGTFQWKRKGASHNARWCLCGSHVQALFRPV